MSIPLYPHNQTAYERVLSLMTKTGKAAVIHPTGTGKSFIGFKLAEQYPDKLICWLSPSEYIYNTQLENLKTAANGYEPENILFATYSKLMMADEERIKSLKPAYIVLDEFHRCGAAEWGKGVERLLTAYPDVPILGLSATNIRYLDNRRDMADELFDGNIASEMTLGEAIVRNILLPPVYITSIYSYKKDFEKYQRRVKNAKNNGVRDAAQKHLDALKRTLSKADGLDAVFDKHMKDRQGKYIVFCANKEHMDEMIGHVPEWFGKIDREPKIYSMYSQDSASEKELAAFKRDSDPHLKLLFSIDMLNEGIHVEDISGVILFRPTVSPIIYKQQIGRVLSASKGKEPVIFDVVNNFENLYSISAIDAEMREAVEYLRKTDKERSIINVNFHIIEEVGDCRRIFGELQDSLSASWDMMFEEAKKYYDTHGNLLVPYSYKSNNLSLGMWIITQRKVKNGVEPGKLTEERIKKLDSIGMIWEGVTEFNWNKKYQAAKMYYETYGTLNVIHGYITPDGFELGKWIAGLRIGAKGKYTTLSKERIRLLDEIGMIWDKEEYRWELNFKEAQLFYSENGHLNVPVGYITPNGISLGAWLKRVRGIYFKKAWGKLSAEQIKRLDSIGMIWRENCFDYKWEQSFAKAKAYYEKHGNIDVTANYVTEDGFKLGYWIWLQKCAKNNSRMNNRAKLNDKRIAKLETIGMVWDKPNVHEKKWENNFNAFMAYYEKADSLSKPKYKDKEEKKYKEWLRRQNEKLEKRELTKRQIGMLDSLNLDMIWRKNDPPNQNAE